MSTHKSGDTTVIWDDAALQAQIRATLADLPRVVADRLARTRDAVLDVALGEWPVDSGESKASIEPVDELNPVRVGIRATAEHVPFIKGDPWDTLVVVPFERRMLDVEAELVADIEALFARNGGR